MSEYQINPSLIQGVCEVPASKSQCMRAILLASMAKGESRISSYLNSPDIDAMISACQAFGAKIRKNPEFLEIEGVDASPQVMPDVIDAGNSGQVLRFIGAMAGLIDGYSIIKGDHSLRSQRSVAPLISGLEQLGCFAVSSKNDGYAPLVVRGCIQGGEIEINGADSQPVSGLIMATCFAKQDTQIRVTNSGELPWIGLTLSWLDKLGLRYQAKLGEHYHIFGRQFIHGFDYKVAGDFSSAAFLLVAAAIQKTRICLKNLQIDDAQGDKRILEVLARLGFKLEIAENEIGFVGEHQGFSGFDVDMNAMIDALPIMAVLACFAESPSHLYGAKIARNKESDRISTITQELRKMGASFEEYPDGMKIWPSKLKGAVLHSHHDHRIAMALSVAAMAAEGSSLVREVDCVAKSFPNFLELMQSLGAKIELQ